jgi:hypothetical protein
VGKRSRRTVLNRAPKADKKRKERKVGQASQVLRVSSHAASKPHHQHATPLPENTTGNAFRAISRATRSSHATFDTDWKRRLQRTRRQSTVINLAGRE